MELVNTTTTTDPVNMYNYVNTIALNPFSLVFLILMVVAVYAFSSSSSSSSSGGTLSSNYLGNMMESTDVGSSNNNNSMFGTIIGVILLFLILVNAVQYFFSINVSAYVQGLFTPKTTVDIVVDDSSYQPPQPAPVPEIKFRKQVFNIPGNYYTYDNAKALCSAYGAKLATYDQIESAYNKGAEWCNYGWSANQLALFPTQKASYDHLQQIKGHENDCGRTGVNGGYIANPNVKFGVNCYGYKPKMTGEEDELMKTISPYPETMEDIAFQKEVDKMKTQIDNILVSPFNHTMWTQV